MRWLVLLTFLLGCNQPTASEFEQMAQVKTLTLRPSGAGLTQLFPVGAANNWDCVDEATANDDTDYVRSTDSNVRRDAYTHSTNLPNHATISSVRVYIRSTSIEPDRVSPLVRISGTAYDGTLTEVSDGAWHDISYEWTTNPATSSNWTISDISSLQFGVQHVPDADGVFLYTTQVYAVVTYTNSQWGSAVSGEHSFLMDADTALVSYLTDATIAHSDVASLISFLSTQSVDFEATGRIPDNYSKGMFPRVHVFTSEARTIRDETNTSLQVNGQTTLSVWTVDTDVITAASQNAAIAGAVTSAIEQWRYVAGTDWATDYANGTDDPSIQVQGPEFLDTGGMGALVKSDVIVSWEHFDD